MTREDCPEIIIVTVIRRVGEREIPVRRELDAELELDPRTPNSQAYYLLGVIDRLRQAAALEAAKVAPLTSSQTKCPARGCRLPRGH